MKASRQGLPGSVEAQLARKFDFLGTYMGVSENEGYLIWGPYFGNSHMVRVGGLGLRTWG